MNSGQGKIHVQARNGKPPYTYELFNTDMTPVGVPANTTGEFNFGAYGERYIVKITDDCGKSFPVEVFINTLDNIPLISGTPAVCNDGRIELKCIFIGAQSYEWTTPNGVVSERILTIDNVDETYAGKYKIRVKPAGCDLSISDSIEVNVMTTPAPVIADTFNICRGGADKILSVAPLPNHSIQWYDDSGAPLAGEPRISASIAAEYLYFVEQTNNSRGCSTRRPVRTIVHDIVDENVSASGWSCPQANPTIEITGAIEGYSYLIYANSALTDTIIEFRGTASDPMILSLPRTVAQTSVFYLGAGSEGCRANSAISTVNISVDEMSIEPATLPVYEHDQPYAVQFSTNAIPVFSLEGSLVTGLIFTVDGMLSGTVPSSAGRATSEFTLTVRDAKGCPATRSYTLQTCEPAPDTRDTVYCQGAVVDPLVAVASNNLTLKWYDEQMQQLPAAPIPDTRVAGVQTFYVSQLNTEIACESPMATILVRVNPLPEARLRARADRVCINNPTSIHLDSLNANYQYLICNDTVSTENVLASFNGAEQGSILMGENLVADHTYYIRVRDDAGCISSAYREVSAEVTSLDIQPETIPLYVVNEAYEQVFVSNASPATFSLAGTLPAEISFSSDGRLSGTVRESNVYSEFTVTVTDSSNCTATRAYVFQTCEPAPDTRDTAYCQGAVVDPLVAVSRNHLPLKWYNEQMQQLPAAPTPDTRVAGVQTFYVSQFNTELGCESPWATILVRVNPLPDAILLARADRVCINNPTNIHLDSLNANYQYLIYNDTASTKILLAIFDSAEHGVVPMSENLVANHTYYIRVLDDAGCLSSAYRTVRAEVTNLDIQPETIPPYVVNQAYEQLFVSNASPATFSITGALPAEISFSIDGRLSGIIQESNVYAEFTVTVTDTANCTASRRYLLAGNLVVPKVFTPNGDGINDVFMPTYKIIVFDRLGIEIYSGTDGWDGTYKGKPVPLDIYFYKISYPDPQSGMIKSKTGYVGVER